MLTKENIRNFLFAKYDVEFSDIVKKLEIKDNEIDNLKKFLKELVNENYLILINSKYSPGIEQEF